MNRGQKKLVLLGALFALPFALGWLAYLAGWAPGATANYGTLLEPQPLAAPPLAALRGKWVLVHFDGGACGPACEKKLYVMRQVRRAQGRAMGRIERLWLATDSVEPRAELLAAIEGTIRAPAGDLAVRFPAAGAVTDHIYLVDPLGNLMMRFPRDPDPSKVLKDLERLLKYSLIG